jgi:benzoyl-CoA reductase/2-hydroxyglutaryl-CoA dehydratase subunit BcrC/BadD/HgdB
MLQGGAGRQAPGSRLLVCSTNICKTVIKWYEVVARKYNVPLIVDIPFLHGGLTRDLGTIPYQFGDFEKFLAD